MRPSTSNSNSCRHNSINKNAPNRELVTVAVLVSRVAPILTLICLGVAHAESATNVAPESAGQRPIDGHNEAAHGSLLAEACASGPDFTSLAQFGLFVAELKATPDEQLTQRLNKSAASNCVKWRQALLELEPLLVTRDVCDPAKIDALLEYRASHLAEIRNTNAHANYANSTNTNSHGNLFSAAASAVSGRHSRRRWPALLHRFFSKYAIQVAHTCKRNLIKNLELSRAELQERSKVFETAREKIFREEPSIRSNIKLIEEQSDEPSATNVKPRDEAEMTLSEYRDALTKLKRPEDVLTFERRHCLRSKARRVRISADKVRVFFKPALMCLQLERYYAGSVLSIAKLANAGYLAVDDELDLRLADSPLVKDWIVATQVCEPMLYMRTERTDADWALIDTCAERVSSPENMAFEEDNFEELDNEMLEEMLPKSEATRHQAQRIMKSAMKKIAKVNLVRQLKSGKLKKRSIFKKSLQMLGSTGAAGALAEADLSAGDTEAARCRAAADARMAAIDVSSFSEQAGGKMPDEKSFDELMEMLTEGADGTRSTANPDDDAANDSSEGAVSMFDPLTSLASSVTVIAIMLTFEWLFFIVMTLAARICHRLNFQLDNILTFPPKVLSWSDADFTQFNDGLEKLDEDDFFDFDELNPDEQRQREMLAKVFGKPPPMLFRD